MLGNKNLLIFLIKAILLLLVISFNHSHAYDHAPFLKGGLTYAEAKINALTGTEDEFHGFGINTSYGYRWIQSDFYITSNIYFGKIRDLSFQADGEKYTGSGDFRSVTIGPTYKHILPYKIKKIWHFYFSVGPHWSIQSIKFKDYTTTNVKPTQNFKLSYESFGASIGFGIEEQTPYKEMHPVFLEVQYIKRTTYKVSVVDTTNEAEINIVTTNEAKQDITENILLINIGITIF